MINTVGKIQLVKTFKDIWICVIRLKFNKNINKYTKISNISKKGVLIKLFHVKNNK